MNRIGKLARILRQFWRRRRTELEIEEELESFLATSIEAGIRSGLSDETARRLAQKESGSIFAIKERIRDVRSEFMFDSILQDIRHALRLFSKHRALTATSVLTVAVGVAAATTVFTFVNAMLRQPPSAVKDPDSIVGLWLGQKAQPDHRFDIQLSNPQFEALRSVQDVFSDMALYMRTSAIVAVDVVAEPVNVEIVAGNHFPMLGIVPMIGRAIGPEDDKFGATPVAMISHDFGSKHFGDAAAALGRTIQLSNKTYTIVGITPASYDGVMIDWYEFPKVWVPLREFVRPAALARRGSSNPVLARLRPGVDFAAAEKRVNELINITIDPSEDYKNSHVDRPNWMSVVPLNHMRVSPPFRSRVAALFATLMGVSLMVLFAGCFNVGSFLLGQTTTRRHEMAVRIALGASRIRLIRQLLTESLMLSVIAAVIGTCLSVALSTVAVRSPKLFVAVPLYAGSIDVEVIGFAIVVTFVTALVFGLLPALLASGGSPSTTLKHSSADWLWSGFRLSPRQVLLTIQVAFAVLLAVTGTHYARSLFNVVRLDPGFNTDDVLIATLNASRVAQDHRPVVDREILDAVSTIPGVQAASFSWPKPSDGSMLAPRFRLPSETEFYDMPGLMVTEDFFNTLNTRLVAGRSFHEPHDRTSSIIVNQTLADQMWPGESPLGKVTRVRLNSDESERVVIGVVAQANCSDHLRDARPCIYLPFYALSSLTLRIMEVRLSGDAGISDALRETVQRVNPALLVYDIQWLDDHMRNRIAPQTMSATSTGILAIVGIALSAIGCYSVFSSMVKQSNREIALHMALGASINRLVRRIMVRSAILCTTGIGCGIIGATLVARRLNDQLFQVDILDLRFLFGVGFVLAAILMIASFVPARSVTKADPASSLRLI